MVTLSKIFDILVYSNIYISLGAASLTYTLFKVIEASINYILLVPFFIMFLIYTFNNKTDTKEDSISNSKKSEFNMKYNKYFLAFALSGYVLSVIFGFTTSIWGGIAVLVPLIIGFLYSKKYIPSKSGKMRLKDILFLKNFVVALTWAYTTTILPVILLSLPITQEIIFFGMIIFFLLLSNTIFFDIKDIYGDSKNGIQTIPITYGRIVTIKILVFLNSLLAYFALIAYRMQLFRSLLITIGIFASAYGFFYILLYKLNIIEINNLSYVITDGEFIAIGAFIYSLTTSF